MPQNIHDTNYLGGREDELVKAGEVLREAMEAYKRAGQVFLRPPESQHDTKAVDELMRWFSERLEAVNDTALSLRSAQEDEASSWRPIETAPKKTGEALAGPAVLVMRARSPEELTEYNARREMLGDPPVTEVPNNAFNTAVAWWEGDERSGKWMRCIGDGRSERCIFRPTHWMPLPPPTSSGR